MEQSSSAGSIVKAEDTSFLVKKRKREAKQAKKDAKKRLKLQNQTQQQAPTIRNNSTSSAGSQINMKCDTDVTKVHGSSRKPSSSSSSSSSWSFTVDYNDHFETPLDAYKDIVFVLELITRALRKTKAELVIYDPYWCKGSVVNNLKVLGFTSVINKNRDFYSDIDKVQIPSHDVLLTNPPYSGDHKQRLLKYLSNATTPFLLLLPSYTASKSYWREFVEISSNVGMTMQYLMPKHSYNYHHPEGTGKDIPPFYSCWFIGARACVRATDVSNEFMKQKSEIRLLASIDDMVKHGYITMKRANPKRRKKRRSQIQEAKIYSSG